jgi:hypothetical protein
MFPAHMPPELARHLRYIGFVLSPPAEPRAPAPQPQPLPPARFDADGQPDF